MDSPFRPPTPAGLASILCTGALFLHLTAPSGIAADPPAPAPAREPAKSGWVYPVQPGTSEWKDQIAAGRTPWELCDLPEGLAARLDTAELVDVVLRYPMRGDAVVFNTLEQALRAIRERFRGVDELLRRPDAGLRLLERLEAMPLAEVPGNARPDRFPNFLDVTWLDALLLSPGVIEGLDEGQARRLVQAALLGNRTLRKAHLRVDGSEAPGRFGLLPLVLRTLVLHPIPVLHRRGAITGATLPQPLRETLRRTGLAQFDLPAGLIDQLVEAADALATRGAAG